MITRMGGKEWLNNGCVSVVPCVDRKIMFERQRDEFLFFSRVENCKYTSSRVTFVIDHILLLTFHHASGLRRRRPPVSGTLSVSGPQITP